MGTARKQALAAPQILSVFMERSQKQRVEGLCPNRACWLEKGVRMVLRVSIIVKHKRPCQASVLRAWVVMGTWHRALAAGTLRMTAANQMPNAPVPIARTVRRT